LACARIEALGVGDLDAVGVRGEERPDFLARSVTLASEMLGIISANLALVPTRF